jgi:parallel beta-helix repeat protein
VTIDGYIQPGDSPNTKAVGDNAVLKVQLDGSKGTFDNGLDIATADSSVIRGLAINRFLAGISISGDSVANRIEGNFIGPDPTSSLDRANNSAVDLINGLSETVIGGDTTAARNVLSGSSHQGIFVAGANGNRIQRNYVGTDNSGTKKLGNVLRRYPRRRLVRHHHRGHHGRHSERDLRQRLKRSQHRSRLERR